MAGDPASAPARERNTSKRARSALILNAWGAPNSNNSSN